MTEEEAPAATAAFCNGSDCGVCFQPCLPTSSGGNDPVEELQPMSGRRLGAKDDCAAMEIATAIIFRDGDGSDADFQQRFPASYQRRIQWEQL